MSRFTLFRLVCGVVFGISTSVASAALVTFFETGSDTAPVGVITNLTGPSGATSTPIITSTTETATVDGFHFPGLSPFPVVVGLHSAGLLDPDTGLLSELVFVNALPIGSCIGIGICQELKVLFLSETTFGLPLESFLFGHTDGGALVGSTYGGALVEDGTLQDISTLLGTVPEGLIVRVKTDVKHVPEPASLSLVSLGIAGFVFGRRKQKFV